MPSNREHVLPSGAKLQITTATFDRALELFKAYSEEMGKLGLPETMSDIELDKNIFCVLIDSKRVEKCLAECIKSVTYNGLPVTTDTFKEPEAWGDYVPMLREVARDNLDPLRKHLSQSFPVAAEILRRFLE